MTAAPPTRPATGAPLLCAHCGYALLGLAETGACPECATPVRISVAAQRGRFPAAQHLPAAHRSLSLLLLSTIGAAVLLLATFASFFAVPSNWHLPYAGAALGVAWLLWHGAWWRLAASDPTLPSDSPRSRDHTVVRVVAVLSVLWLLAFAAFATMTLAAPFRGISLPLTSRTILYSAPVLLAAAQVWAGSRLLARYTIPRRRGNRPFRRPDLPALRRSALLTFVLTSAEILLSPSILFRLLPSMSPASMMPFIAATSMASTYLFFGLGFCGLVTTSALLAALVDARSRTRDALDDRRLLAAAAQEFASERAP